MDEPAVADVEDRLRPHVQHILDRLFRPGELDGWCFVWQGETPLGPRHLAVILTAVGETHYAYVWQEHPEYPPEEGLDVLADGVEDFIAESRFAWGQQRMLTDRPWSQRL